MPHCAGGRARASERSERLKPSGENNSQDFGAPAGPPDRRGTVSLPAARSKNKKARKVVARDALLEVLPRRVAVRRLDPTGLSPERHGRYGPSTGPG